MRQIVNTLKNALVGQRFFGLDMNIACEPPLVTMHIHIGPWHFGPNDKWKTPFKKKNSV